MLGSRVKWIVMDVHRWEGYHIAGPGRLRKVCMSAIFTALGALVACTVPEPTETGAWLTLTVLGVLAGVSTQWSP